MPHRASRHVRATAVALILASILLLAPSLATAASPTPGIAVHRLGSSASIGTSNLPRYSHVNLSMAEYGYIAAIKLASPSTEVLGEKAGMTMRDDCGTLVDTCGSGITYQQALAHDAANPNDPWVLRDAAGNSITHPAYPREHAADVGSASYQQQWLQNVASAETKYGFDGVYIDNVLAQISGFSGGVYPTLYPSDSAWESAMKSFMAYVGPQLQAKGFYVLTNTYKGGTSDGTNDVAWWKAVGPYVNGLLSEYWIQNPNSLTQLYDTNPCCWTGHWEGWLRLAEAAKSTGADFFPLLYGASTDTRIMRYGKASFLLVWDGAGGGFIFNPTDPVDPWNPAWTTDIGTPVAARYQVGVGWRRNYTRGTALVNPNAFSAQTFALGGRYLTPSGATVTSVTLQPVTAMVLRKRLAKIRVSVRGTLVLLRHRTIRVSARNSSTLRALRRARVTVWGAGLVKRSRLTNRYGKARFLLRPTRLGKVTFRVSKASFATAYVYRRVRLP